MSWTDGQTRKKDMDGLARDKTTWTGLPAENTTWTGLPAKKRHGRTCPQKNDMDGLARRKTTWTGLSAEKRHGVCAACGACILFSIN